MEPTVPLISVIVILRSSACNGFSDVRVIHSQMDESSSTTQRRTLRVLKAEIGIIYSSALMLSPISSS